MIFPLISHRGGGDLFAFLLRISATCGRTRFTNCLAQYRCIPVNSGVRCLVLIFRGLIVSFAAMYVLTMSFAGLEPDAPALALEYQRWVEAQPVAGGAWGLSCAVGHLPDMVGLAVDAEATAFDRKACR